MSYKLHINNECTAIKPEIKYYVLCLMSYVFCLIPPIVRSVAARADSSEQDRGQRVSSLLLQAAQSTACPCRRSAIVY